MIECECLPALLTRPEEWPCPIHGYRRTRESLRKAGINSYEKSWLESIPVDDYANLQAELDLVRAERDALILVEAQLLKQIDDLF